MVLAIDFAESALKTAASTYSDSIAKIMSSPEFPMAARIDCARVSLLYIIAESVRVAYGTGQSWGELTMPFEYDLDIETSKSMVQDLITLAEEYGLALSVTAFSRDGRVGVQGFKVYWKGTENEHR